MNRSVLSYAKRLVFIFVVLATSLVLAAPAQAVVSVGGPGTGDTGGNGNGGNSGSGSTKCVKNFKQNGVTYPEAGVIGGTLIYAYWPGCDGYNWQNDYTWCEVGEQVWRFYGNAQDPTQSYTVSDAWSPQACPNSNTYQYARFAPNPDDDTQDNSALYRSPWYVGSRTYPAVWDPSKPVAYAPSPIEGPDAGKTRISTSKPFRTSGAGCQVLQGNANIGQYFDKSNQAVYTSSVALQVRKALYAAFVQAEAAWGNSAYAYSVVDAKQGVLNTDIDGSPELDYNDGYGCSSDLDFAMSMNNTPASQIREFGTCSISLIQQARYFYQGSNSVYSVRSDTATYFSGDASNLPNDPVLQSYRQKIQDDINGRPGIYEPFSNTKANLSQTAQYVASHTQCAWGQGALSQKVDNTAPNSNGPPIDIVHVSTPAVAHVGGSLDQATITVHASDTLQGADPTVGPFLKPGTVQMNLTLNAPADAVECTTAGQANCDYRIVSKNGPDSNGNATWVIEYYKASLPGDNWSVSVSGTAQAYYYEAYQLFADASINTMWTGVDPAIAINTGDLSNLVIKSDPIDTTALLMPDNTGSWQVIGDTLHLPNS